MGAALLYLAYAEAAYAAVIALLFALSPLLPAAGFYARCLISIAMLIVCSIYGFTASLTLRIFGYGGLGQYLTARAFKWTMWLALGVGFEIEGAEHLNSRPAVLVGNHQTELDILVLGYVFPPYCSVSAKKSLKWYPFLGWFMWASNTVFIDRGNRQQAGEALKGAVKQITVDKQNVWMFPEGTRSYTAKADMLAFKKGAFHLAVQAQVPIVPVVVANYSNLFHVQTRRFTSGICPIKVLPPISTVGLTTDDVSALTERVRDMMMDELVAITQVARANRIAMPIAQANARDETDVIKATGQDRTGAKSRPGI